MKISIYSLLTLLLCLSCSNSEDTGKYIPVPLIVEVPDNFPDLEYDLENNPVTDAGFELGKKLFYDGRLSSNNSIPCVFCHEQAFAFTHHGPNFSHGVNGGIGFRNAQPIQHLAFQNSFMWDGAASHLDLQPIIPITSELEMGEILSNVINKLKQDPYYQEQFDSARKIVRYAKQSIHECAEHYLTAARAGVDFAMTSSPSEVSHIVQQTNDYLRELKTAYPKEDVAQQVHVINARICYLQNDSEKAKTMMESLDYRHWEDKPTEALIDSAKAFHEVGLQGNALKILEVLEQKLSDSDSDSDEPNLVSFYIKQEKREKASIPLSPKSLNNAAVLHYQQGDLAKSFNTFLQAYQVMPKNPAIALNLLQAITMRAKQGQPRINKVVSLVKRCRTTIESSELTEEQTQRYNNMKTVLNQVA